MPPTEDRAESPRWVLNIRGLEVRERWRALCDAAIARQDARILATVRPHTFPPVLAPH